MLMQKKEIRLKMLEFSQNWGVEIHVWTSLPARKPILKDVSISAPKGKMIAVVGPAGSRGESSHHEQSIVFYDVDVSSISFDGTDIRDLIWSSLQKSGGNCLAGFGLFSARQLVTIFDLVYQMPVEMVKK